MAKRDCAAVGIDAGIVGRNSKVTQNGDRLAGEVIRISDNTLLVRETYVDYLGEATTKEIEMRVRSKAQGG